MKKHLTREQLERYLEIKLIKGNDHLPSEVMDTIDTYKASASLNQLLKYTQYLTNEEWSDVVAARAKFVADYQEDASKPSLEEFTIHIYYDRTRAPLQPWNYTLTHPRTGYEIKGAFATENLAKRDAESAAREYAETLRNQGSSYTYNYALQWNSTKTAITEHNK